MNILNGWKKIWDENKSHFKATIYDNPYIPHDPFLNQVKFLIYPAEEVLYGGQAGGGKSDGLLMSALQYINYPNYSALLLRRTYQDLSQPNAIMDRAKTWLAPFTKRRVVKWNNATKTFTFPSGATLSFGYLSHDNDLDQYQGAELQFIGFDELTQFTEKQYTYLHSRLRKLEDNDIPLRMRAGTNPGGRGHDWVKERFITGDVPFIQSSYTDNLYLNIEEYSKSLDKLDELTKLQLKHGDWDAVINEGLLLNREQFNNSLIDITEFNDWTSIYGAIGIDPAGTGSDRFSMACIVMFEKGNERIACLVDLDSTQSSSPEEQLKNFIIRNSRWKPRVINFEREPGSGSTYALNYWNSILQPLCREYHIYIKDTPASTTGSKYNRARPHANLIKEDLFKINKGIGENRGDYNPLFNLGNQYIYVHPDKEEMKQYASPDELDSVSYAFNEINHLFKL